MASKYHEIEIDAPVLKFLESDCHKSGGSLSKSLARLAAAGRLSALEGEIAALRRAVAKETGGPAELRVKLAEAESRSDRVGERELRAHYDRQASKIRKQLREG